MFVWCLNFFVKFRFRAFLEHPVYTTQYNRLPTPVNKGKWHWSGMRKPFALLCRRVRYHIHAHTHAVYWYRLITWLLSRKLQKNVVNREIIWTVKGTVSVISSVESPCTERNPNSQRYRWNLYLINNLKATVVFKC